MLLVSAIKAVHLLHCVYIYKKVLQGYLFTTDIKVCIFFIAFIYKKVSQGYLFTTDIKVCTGICLGDILFVQCVNK